MPEFGTLADDLLLVSLNFSAATPIFELPGGLPASQPQLLIANYEVAAGDNLSRLPLRPYEARVYRLR